MGLFRIFPERCIFVAICCLVCCTSRNLLFPFSVNFVATEVNEEEQLYPFFFVAPPNKFSCTLVYFCCTRRLIACTTRTMLVDLQQLMREGGMAQQWRVERARWCISVSVWPCDGCRWVRGGTTACCIVFRGYVFVAIKLINLFCTPYKFVASVRELIRWLRGGLLMEFCCTLNSNCCVHYYFCCDFCW